MKFVREVNIEKVLESNMCNTGPNICDNKQQANTMVIVTFIWQKLNTVEREVKLIVIDFWQLFSHIIGETQHSQRLLKGTYWLVVPLHQIDVNSAANTV